MEAFDEAMAMPNAQQDTSVESTEVVRPNQPRKIKALDFSVINKIAAGEIIVAPVNALKEMLENSVDAGATSIEVLVKEGGLKLLQITDNGHGIDKQDLPILCERFTTSKLQAFEDLQSIDTYGFRGEALASISHISHLSVTTRTGASSCAWKAHYNDGKLAPPKPGHSTDPKAIAGKVGTQITVEDLFYSIPTRKRAFRSPSEEYAKIVDLVGRYAVHREGVAFSCRKHGDSSAGISVPAAASAVDRIRQIHGNAAASELVEIEASDEDYGYSLTGRASTVNYHAKRIIFLLFINHRAVECTPIRKAIDHVYHNFLPKGQHPFVYINLSIDPKRVDVNVHPTKKEVRFLHEEEIVEQIGDAIKAKLSTGDSSRTFLTQSLLRDDSSAGVDGRGFAEPDSTLLQTVPPTLNPKTPAKVYENNLVRTDPRSRKITSMMQPLVRRHVLSSPEPSGDGRLHPDSYADLTDNLSSDPVAPTVPRSGFKYTYVPTEPTPHALASLKDLRTAVRDKMHSELTQTFASHTFVGIVDTQRRLATMQTGVKLFLVDYGLVAREYFYQLGLTDFGNFGKIEFDPPLDLRELLVAGAKTEARVAEERGLVQDSQFDWEGAVEVVLQRLVDRKEMLAEYFKILLTDGIDDVNQNPEADTLEDERVLQPKLLAIPLMMKDYMPSIAKLPRFLLRLGPYVEWRSEKKCFHSFLTEMALFHVPEALPNAGQDDKEPAEVDAGDEGTADVDSIRRMQQRREELHWSIEHALFPAFKSRLIGTRAMLGGVVEVANLKGLYRVFERC